MIFFVVDDIKFHIFSLFGPEEGAVSMAFPCPPKLMRSTRSMFIFNNCTLTGCKKKTWAKKEFQRVNVLGRNDWVVRSPGVDTIWITREETSESGVPE